MRRAHLNEASNHGATFSGSDSRHFRKRLQAAGRAAACHARAGTREGAAPPGATIANTSPRVVARGLSAQVKRYSAKPATLNSCLPGPAVPVKIIIPNAYKPFNFFSPRANLCFKFVFPVANWPFKFIPCNSNCHLFFLAGRHVLLYFFPGNTCLQHFSLGGPTVNLNYFLASPGTPGRNVEITGSRQSWDPANRRNLGNPGNLENRVIPGIRGSQDSCEFRKSRNPRDLGIQEMTRTHGNPKQTVRFKFCPPRARLPWKISFSQGLSSFKIIVSQAWLSF